MSNPGDAPELEPLEESAAPDAAPSAPAITAVIQPGMPAPVFSTKTHKEYYRFFFCGLIMFLGCMMPFGPEWEMAGYKTLGGALFTVISLGIMWSSWAAIAHGRFGLTNLKWLLFAGIPFGVMLFHIIYAWEEPAVKEYVLQAIANSPAQEEVVVDGWAKLGDYILNFKTPRYSLALDNFVRYFGPGKIVLFLGSLMALFYLAKAFFGGITAGRGKKAEQAPARSGKRGRR